MQNKQLDLYSQKCSNCALYTHPCTGCSYNCNVCEQMFWGENISDRLSFNCDFKNIQKFFGDLLVEDNDFSNNPYIHHTPNSFPLDSFIVYGPSKKLDLKEMAAPPYNMKYYCNSLAQRVRKRRGILQHHDIQKFREYIEIDDGQELLFSFSIDDILLNAIWKNFYNHELIKQLQKISPYMILSPNFGPTQDMPGLEIFFNFRKNIIIWKRMLANNLNAIPCLFWNNDYYKNIWIDIFRTIHVPWVYTTYTFFYGKHKEEIAIDHVGQIDSIIPKDTGIIIVGINNKSLIKKIIDLFPHRIFSFFVSEPLFNGSKGSDIFNFKNSFQKYRTLFSTNNA